ncbi:DSD1 family PLP-dependent enzyme [Nocardia bovistercoris]|uniref:DSD1 family PLP-dependent enzyme n=1 Tax=Nocardia bovistercoris TaxID=2785916 RepID=A0A931IDQ2_9NOCA|nr:DSD1 family PLP-dependent enzyme [Nocardia bovistercoris]MBH0777940.1 DSD1 family PLP-dependent enzyme [Nocardia bovistercoris]
MSESPAAALARAMVGEPGSRHRLPTPALVLDEAALDANIAAMAARVRGKVRLRPHAKTHKSAWIARKQIAHGAVGVCCAKLGEAEALSAAGVRAILLTSPIADATAPARLCEVAKVDPSFVCVVDHPDPVTALAAEAHRRDLRIAVAIDVDVGLMRTGVAGPAEALELAAHIARFPSLELAGVQGYGGHWQHIPGYHARRDAVRLGMDRLSAVVAALRAGGHRVDLVTGGGTGTVAADLELGVLDELQPGSYVFMDAQYADALGDDPDGQFRTSLWVASQVVSVNATPIVTVDAGLKAFATEGPAPRPSTAPFADSTYAFYGDEHGALTRPPDIDVRLGLRVELLTPHCDPTVDRYDSYHVVRGDTLVAIVPIDAARSSR